MKKFSEKSDLLDKGYNPIRWDCEKQGCFNKRCRPKVEIFCDCFSGRNNFGDIDFFYFIYADNHTDKHMRILERCGKGLILEWKNYIGEIPKGQEIMYKQLTKTKLLTVFCVAGNPETMNTYQYSIFYNGKYFGPHLGRIADVKLRMNKWEKWAISTLKNNN